MHTFSIYSSLYCTRNDKANICRDVSKLQENLDKTIFM